MNTVMLAQDFLSAEDLLGAPSPLPWPPRPALEWVSVIRRGLSAAAVDALAKSLKISRAELSQALNIPERTLARRKREGSMSSEESAKLVRLARVVHRAEEVFEGLDVALDWLKSPNAALSGQTPLNLVDTEMGAELVLDTLGRIEHGVFA
ncbi:MAG TPA: antitoxin Xre/MbcA/ParS toxin-binding domain-containing protein [Methylococcaceae bacterium]|nr:antitoxin Xre/MbcA/ParS toxin-binding domain-containing protein [Methylococcaceae bacterium]